MSQVSSAEEADRSSSLQCVIFIGCVAVLSGLPVLGWLAILFIVPFVAARIFTRSGTRLVDFGIYAAGLVAWILAVALFWPGNLGNASTGTLFMAWLAPALVLGTLLTVLQKRSNLFGD